MTQHTKARDFIALHRSGDPLILTNIWDAGSAAVADAAGAKAIATGSDSVAAAQGFDDGEQLPFGDLVRTAQQICARTDLPVSIDMEAGYARAAKDVADNVSQLLDAGCVGINLEDQIVGSGKLYAIEEQVARIAAVRAMAEQRGLPLFINARCDVFLTTKPETHPALIVEALRRAEAYARAGASGFFVPLLTDLKLIADVVSECRMGCRLPVNVLAMPGGEDLAALKRTGVARISQGPFPYRQTMETLGELVRTVSAT